MTRPIIALALLATLAGCKSEAPAKPAALEVSDAIVRLAPVEGRPAAAYFILRGGKTTDRLVAISSPAATTIELHENKMENGIMDMQPLTGVDLPASGEVTFRPGGHHAMLFGIDPTVKAGGTLPLRFTFQSGVSLDAEAKTIAAGDDMPMGHEGH